MKAKEFGPFLVGNFLVATAVAMMGLVVARGLLYCVRGQGVAVRVEEE